MLHFDFSSLFQVVNFRTIGNFDCLKKQTTHNTIFTKHLDITLKANHTVKKGFRSINPRCYSLC